MKNHLIYPLLMALLLLSAHAGTTLAVEIAPRISDREIVERLTRLESGQQAIIQQMDVRFSAMEKRMDERFVAMENRMDERLDAQWSLTLVLIVAIFGLIGFVVWDRKTALSPLERRFARIAEELERDLETDNPKGSKLARLVEMLREMASKDPRLADAFGHHFPPEGLPGKA
uniref:Uncharacterized protein n=1 Tax=Candidatus Kentrum sp. DK TaxID=2126562 RepID=A0A450T0R5_9GAMM|nr:MAG: hypothetical protein BECKDK2373B_GA0170837_108916 [Candidatus Kentron sp. DK]